MNLHQSLSMALRLISGVVSQQQQRQKGPAQNTRIPEFRMTAYLLHIWTLEECFPLIT